MLSEGLFPEYGYCKLSLKKSELWHEEYLLPLPCLLQVYLLMPSCACVLIQVAAVSGDARRALDICRRAVELAQQGSQIVKVKKLHVISHRSCILYPLYFYTHPMPSVLPHSLHLQVQIEHINAALAEMSTTPSIVAMAHTSLHERLFLIAVSTALLRI